MAAGTPLKFSYNNQNFDFTAPSNNFVIYNLADLAPKIAFLSSEFLPIGTPEINLDDYSLLKKY